MNSPFFSSPRDIVPYLICKLITCEAKKLLHRIFFSLINNSAFLLEQIGRSDIVLFILVELNFHQVFILF